MEKQVKSVIAKLFSLDTKDIGADTSLGTVEKWDSLGHVNLIMSLEQVFDVRIPVEEAAEMTSFVSVCQVLRRHLGGGR